MTDEKMQTLKDDIAFMRALAQEGSSVPLLFGAVMVAAGLIFGAGAVGHWLLASDILRLSPWFFMVNWIGAGVVFFLVMTVLLRRASTRPGYSSGVNKATGAAWSGVGFAIFASFLGLTAMGLTTGLWEVMAVFPVLILALYGAAWFVAAVLSNKGWIRLVSLGSFAGAVGMGALTGSPWQMLGYAACLLVLAVLPGWLRDAAGTDGHRLRGSPVMEGFDIDGPRRGDPRPGPAGGHGLPLRRGLGRLQHAQDPAAGDRRQPFGSSAQARGCRLRQGREDLREPKAADDLTLTDKGRSAFAAYLDAIGKLVEGR